MIVGNQLAQIGKDSVQLVSNLSSWKIFLTILLKIIVNVVLLIIELCVIRFAYNASIPNMFDGAKEIGWAPAVGLMVLFAFM